MHELSITKAFNTKKESTIVDSFFAESEGFKPPVRTSRTADFESAPFGHSGNFPLPLQKYNLFFIAIAENIDFFVVHSTLCHVIAYVLTLL